MNNGNRISMSETLEYGPPKGRLPSLIDALTKQKRVGSVSLMKVTENAPWDT